VFPPTLYNQIGKQAAQAIGIQTSRRLAIQRGLEIT
jgi:hypothetical protein